jgi:hypothetical protein
MEAISINLLIRKGCGGNESVTARGTEQATDSATTSAVVGVSHPLTRRGEAAAQHGLEGSTRKNMHFGNSALAGVPFPRRKRASNARVTNSCIGV